MKHLKTFFACLLTTVLSIGQMWGGTMSVDFESAASAYTDWIITTITTQQTNSEVSAHGGSYFGSTDGKATGSIVTKNKIASPSSITFYYSKLSTNTKAASWIVKVSEDNSTWTEVESKAAGNGVTKGTWYEFTTDLSSYADVYVGVFYDGNTAARCLDDLVLTTSGGDSQTKCTSPTFSVEEGTFYASSIEVELSCTTTDAVIHYTLDGSAPSASSETYSSAIEVSATTTIKAIAVKDGLTDSDVASATYTKGAGVSGYNIDFESDLVAYVDWNFTNFTKTNDITAHGGSYCAKTNGTNTASITTKAKVANPGVLTYYISKIGTNTNANSKWKARVSSDGTNWTIVGTEYAAGAGVTAGTWNDCTADLTDYTNVYVQVYYDGTSAVRTIDDISLTTVTPGTVATPTISGETPFVTSTTVTLGCTTEGASVYYTTDGSNPSSSSTLYTEPFALNAGATIKAIAIKGNSSSAIASKEFAKVVSYTTLSDIYDKAVEVGETATDIYVTFDSWKISAKNNNNAFLTDGTNGAVIYGNGHGFNAGDVLTGTAACKVQLYKGFAELTSLNSSTTGLTVTSGSVGDPVVKTWDQLSAVNTGALVKLENLSYDGTSLSDGENTIPTYTTFYTASFESGKKYNLTGVYQYYNTNGQILPRSADDVEEIIETYTVIYNNNPDHGTLTIKNGDDVVTSGSAVNEGTELTIVTSPDEGYKLAGVTVNGSAYSETALTLSADVTIAATFELNQAPLVTSYVLSVMGVETSHLNGERVGDKVNLPSTATECSKTFVGWSANASCTVAPEYAPGAEYTLAANNKLYAVYADANIVTPTDHALGSGTFNGTNEGGNTASEGYTFSKSTKGDNKAGYIQDSGTKDETIIFVQIKTESQIINEEPSAIIVTAHLGAGSNKDPLDYPVYAVLVDAEGNNVGDPVVLTTAVSKADDDYSVNLPIANYANVRGVKISHKKEDGWNVRYYSMSFKYQTGGTTYSNYSTDCQAQVKTPTFSPAAGTYTEVKNVTITTETTDATIYYTTNGDEPTTSSTAYSSAIEVGEDMTIKAIAVKSGMVNSEIATAAYTINLPVVLSTMDQIFAAATAASSTATDANIKFNNWVVSGVSTNGKNVFVTDGTKGFIIFDNGGEMGFAVGDVLSGTVACKVQLYKGAAELTTLSSSTEGLSVATGGVVTPVAKAISELSGINTGAPVIINSVQFDGEYLTDGANSIKPYNTLFAYDALTEDTYYNVTGIYQQFDATKEILPRSAADIEEVSLSDPEISYTPASATIELGEELPGTTFANPHELTISYSSNNESVATVNATGVITLGSATGTAVITASFAGDATYAPANVTYTITVNPASVSQNVVILAVYDTKYYAMSTTNASSAFTAIAVEYDGEKVTVNSADDKAAIQWTKKTSGDNTTFQDADSKYMKSADGTSMSLQDAVCNWIWDEGEFYKISGTSRTFFYQNGTGFKNFATSNFNKSGYSDKAQVIVIAPENIVLNTKVDPQLAYDPTSVTLTVGQTFTPATLTYADGFDGLAAVTYESSNTDLATVEGGVVSLVADATGTATITATFAGNNNYQAGSASYTITVNEAGDDLSGTWVLATAVPEIGEKFIVAGTYNNVTKTMGIQNANNRAAVESSLSEGVLTPGEGTKVFTLVDAGEGKFAIQASNGKYLTASGTGTKNYLTEADDYEAANAKWTISISEGIASVVASSSNRNQMQYNKSNPGLFSCYDGGQTAIQLYVLQSATVVTKYTVTYAANGGSGDVPEAVEYEEGETFAVAAADLFTAPEGKEFDKWNDGKNDYAPDDIYTVGTADVVLTAIWKDAPSVDPDPQPEFVALRSGLSVGEFGTYCPKQRVEAYAGATFFKFAYMQFVNETPLKAYFDELDEGEALEAGHPYFYITNAETITGVKTGDEVDDGINDRGFIGKVNAFEFHVTNEAGQDGYYDRVYVVYQNQIMRCSGGYYRLGEEKAYLDVKDENMPKSKEEAQELAPGRRRVSINNREAPQVATGLDELNSNAQAMKVIINDQLFIIRGDKMYDTTGRFVGNVQ